MVYTLKRSDGKLTMVATDGRRLSTVKKDYEFNSESFKGIIIPVKILNLIEKLASGEGEFSIAVSDQSFFVRFDNNKIYSNLIEGQFPNYQRVIPESQDHIAIIRRNDFLAALKRVSILAEQKSKRVFINFTEGSMENIYRRDRNRCCS